MEPNRRRKHQPHLALPPTSIDSLGDDILSNILHRLPTLASVGRAALACTRWRRLATDDDFRRQFGDLHPSAPLLGCFVSFINHEDMASCAFHRAQISSDRDLAAAVRGGDFWLTGLQDDQQWRIRDCRDGILLLASRDQFSLFNPVSRHHIYLSQPTGGKEYDNHSSFHTCFLPDRDGDGTLLTSFRLVSLEADVKTRRLQAHIYSSFAGKWHAYPPMHSHFPRSIRSPAPSSWLHDQSHYPSMHAAGRIYWKHQKGKVLLSLHTKSMEFSQVELPLVPELYRAQALYVVGDTEDGNCCLICVVKVPDGSLVLQVWLRNEEARTWELDKEVSSLFQVENPYISLYLSKVRQVCAVNAGVVLLCLEHSSGRHRYLVFRLKNLDATRNNFRPEVDFITCRGLAAYLYPFTWPSFSLLQQPPDRLIQGGDAASD